MTSLQAKVEGLATTNALMKVILVMVMVIVMVMVMVMVMVTVMVMVMSQEDLSISRTSAEKIQAENKRLRYFIKRQ